ncbi:MAG: hypothetical protein CBC35_01850 [Planctomycetes bacterium TMED75]|nr:hypothetical protein [Planctomycetaceae bacterium]OUU96060.1 MAG: hypothetical protein CBC35_01850 [Planctomycetes bacterium TMED75]
MSGLIIHREQGTRWPARAFVQTLRLHAPEKLGWRREQGPSKELQVMESTHQLGRRGERLAEQYYRRQGYGIIARNLIVHRREIDLLTRTPDGTTLVIVEVKTSAQSIHKARSALDRRKRHRLAEAARALQEMGMLHEHALRVDGFLIDCSGSAPQTTRIEGPLVQGGWGT